MTRASLSHTMNHRDPLGLFKSSHGGVMLNKVFIKYCKFHRKTPVLKSVFNNVAGLQACNFIKKILKY